MRARSRGRLILSLLTYGSHLKKLLIDDKGGSKHASSARMNSCYFKLSPFMKFKSGFRKEIARNVPKIEK